MEEQKLSRGKFIGLVGGMSLLVVAGDYLYAVPVNGFSLIDTATKRKAYTYKLLKMLCDDLGPRPAGSKAYAKGAKILLDEMRISMPSANLDKFQFDGWELKSPAEFVVDGQNLEIVPLSNGLGTAAEGITGIFKKTGSTFLLVDADTKANLADITANSYGKAITSYDHKQSSVPSFRIGKQDIPLLDRAVKNNFNGFIRAQVGRLPNSTGMNIIGQIPGKKKEEILFVAHADTVYNTPGANDNTASVIIMIMLAHAAAARSSNYTLTFVATDNEEFGYLGAKNYANQRLADNTMKDIKYVINFDSLTYGPNLWVSSKNNDLKELIKDIHTDLKLDAKPIYDSSDGFVMDSEPFRESGAKAMHINSRGYDEKTLPVYHRPDDNADNVPLDTVEIGFLVFDEFLKRVDKAV